MLSRSLCLASHRLVSYGKAGLTRSVARFSASSLDSEQQEVLKINKSLLDAIADGDWDAYQSLCCESGTCIEPECSGNIAQGLAFHKYYFDMPPGDVKPQNTICGPHVKMMGDNVALCAYNRVVQVGTATNVFQETRIWERTDEGSWKNTHFHKSKA